MKVIETKKYTIEFITYEDGKTRMIRTNENFSVIELIGTLAMIQSYLTGLLNSPKADETEIISDATPLI
jgi:hypothetical protein